MAQLLSTNEIPDWFSYPPQFLRIVEQGLLNFDPWVILDGDRLRKHYLGLQERYPERDIVPFARREDNDDIMCWEKGHTDEVIIIHDFASKGYENAGKFNSFWDWLRAAIEATIEYDE